MLFLFCVLLLAPWSCSPSFEHGIRSPGTCVPFWLYVGFISCCESQSRVYSPLFYTAGIQTHTFSRQVCLNFTRDCQRCFAHFSWPQAQHGAPELHSDHAKVWWSVDARCFCILPVVLKVWKPSNAPAVRRSLYLSLGGLARVGLGLSTSASSVNSASAGTRLLHVPARSLGPSVRKMRTKQSKCAKYQTCKQETKSTNYAYIYIYTHVYIYIYIYILENDWKKKIHRCAETWKLSCHFSILISTTIIFTEAIRLGPKKVLSSAAKQILCNLPKLHIFLVTPSVHFRKADEAAKGAAKAPTTAAIPAGPPGAGQARDRDWLEACYAFVATLCRACALLHSPVVPAVESCNVRCTGAVLVHLCRSSISMLRDLMRRWSRIAGSLSPFVHLMPCLGSKPEMAHRLALKVTKVSQLVMEAGDSSQTLRRRMATKIHPLCTPIYLVYIRFCYILQSAVTAASSNCFPCEAVDFLTTASMNKYA